MRRLLALALLACSVAAISLVGTGASDDTGSTYLVQAEFRNAFTVIKGEDVKIAGVKVGTIKDLDVTARQTAAVLLEITEPGFGDWRRDAECTIRPQSLIGEKFVECTPTQPRAAGAAEPPLLRTRELDGETVAVLPIDRTRRSVDIDLVNNILRLPYRQRLTIILNEFGAGVAGRGRDLEKIIRTADPSLKATDEVLELLAKQNKTLSELAVNSDQSLEPLARDRDKLASFITQANTVSQATAEERTNLEENIKRLPAFLRELRPTMERLGGLSEQGAPLLADLNTVGPDLGRFVKALGPFSQAGIPAFTSLGDASVVGREALTKSEPIFGDLKEFGAAGKPVAADLRQLTASLRDTGGIERLMDFAYYGVASLNGYDRYGHYLRAQLLVNLCSAYAEPQSADATCTANFVNEDAESRAAPRSAARATAAGGTRTVAGGAASAAPAPATGATGATGSTGATPRTAPASGTTGPGTGVTHLLDYLMGDGA